MEFRTREDAERLRSPKIILMGGKWPMVLSEIRHKPAPCYGADEWWVAVLRPANVFERLAYRIKVWLRFAKPLPALHHIYRRRIDACNWERLRFEEVPGGFKVVSEAVGACTKLPESDQTIVFA